MALACVAGRTAPHLGSLTRLVGRARESASLHAAFTRVAEGGPSECVLIGGPAGCGKSFLVHAWQQQLPPHACWFAGGKFDQFQDEQPYATLAQALQGLTAMVLALPAEDQAAWRAALRAAVDADGARVLSLVPLLEQVIGPQPVPQALAPGQSRAQVWRVLQRVLQVFAQAQRPLLLFLDDLQWADEATLHWLEDLLAASGMRHLLVLGTWRDQEDVGWQPLLARLRTAGARLQEIALQPLAAEDTAAMVGEMLCVDPADSAALAAQVHRRARGNPLFARQWLTELAARGLLVPGTMTGGAWTWDLQAIAAAAAEADAGSIVQLMSARLRSLPLATQHALRQLACLGTQADLGTLQAAAGLDPPALADALRPAVDAGLLHLQGERCAFTHDRAREAAYAELPAAERAASHLRIAEQLRTQCSPHEQQARIFAITDQLNRGIPALQSPAERVRGAELNLVAARRARLSAAYGVVRHHVQTGLQLLPPAPWERCHALAFELHRLQADCSLLTGALGDAEATLRTLVPRARTPAEHAAACRLRVVLHAMRADYAGAVVEALRGLALFGVALPAHPTQHEVDQAHAQVAQLLGGRDIAVLLDLPRSTDAAAEAAMEVLAELFAPACFTDERLAQLHLCQMVVLSLRHGLTDASAQGLAWYGLLLGHHQGRHDEAWRIVQLARSMVERHHLRALQAKSLFALEIASAWTQPLQNAVRLSRAAFTAGTESGDVMVACFSCHHTVNDLLVRGEALPQVAREIETGLAYVRTAGFEDVVDELQTQRRFVRALLGDTPGLADWNIEPGDAAPFESALLRPGRMPTMVFWYWLLRAQSHVFAGQPGQALACLARAERLTWASPVHIQFVHHVFYGALALAALEHGAATPDPTRRARIGALRARLAHWRAHCAANIEDKLSLVDAEIARIEQRSLDAARLYELAAQQARAHGFVQNEALAHERAAQHHAALGLTTGSEAHWRQAHAAYARWGAVGKLRQLEHTLVFLQPAAPTAVADAPAAAAMTAAAQPSQAAMSLENARLVEDLRREIRERQDAERESARVQAALAESEQRFRRMADATPDVLWITELMPERVVYVSPSFERVWGRTAEALYRDPRLWTASIHEEDREQIEHGFGAWIAGGAAAPWTAEYRVVQPGGGVRWIHERGVMISDDKVHRVTGTSTDITERKLAEAALRTSESRFALAAAGSNDGIFDWDIPNDRMYLSERAQRLYGLEPGPEVRARQEWVDMLRQHPDDAVLRTARLWGYLEGRLPAYDGEYRILHADGLYRWVRIQGLCVRDASGRATRMAGSISDIDPHKRAEAALRQTQRLEAVGTLAGGIAHDFNNILGAILGFGEMALRGTRAGSRARRDIEFIMTAGERGRALVERILAFSRSGVSERVPVHIESVTQETLQLLSASVPPEVRMTLRLAAGPAAILGDATQWHQVVMNLVTNALQAMPDGGDLQVVLDLQQVTSVRLAATGPVEPGTYVVLQVADTGAGIAPEHLARIFDPFFTTREAGTGTGLGLSLVHGIVTDFGGAVDVASTPGGGACFTVLLPRIGDAQARSDPAPGPLPRGRHEQILVVDDEEALLRLTTRRLVDLGYVPVGFSAAAEALAAFSAHPERFDAVVTDERMPGLSGTALVGALRRLRPTLPILLVTGYMGAAEVERAQGAGATAVLGKPLATEDLARTLARLLPSGSARSAG